VNGDGSTSPWVWVAWGCGGCLLLSGLSLILAIVVGVRTVKNIESELHDPVAREEKARRVLGAETFPEGYRPAITFSLPFIFDMIILAEGAEGEQDGLAEDTERAFIYLELIRGDRRWRRYAEQGDPSDVLAEQGIRMRGAEEIGRGELVIDGQPIDYVSQRGNLDVQDHEFEGVATFLFIRCPGSKRMRVGIWTHPDPYEELPVEEADYTGTNADPERIREFVSHFDFCDS
jgi:hypothetical protein